MNKTFVSESIDQHIPVLLKEILSAFSQLALNTDGQKLRYFDGTFGRGGHLSAVMEKFPQIECVAFDRDPDAIAYAKERFSDQINEGRLKVLQKNYSDFSEQEMGRFDFMLLDLGVSSPQLDRGERGFSFYHEGPLDMRMDNMQGPTAADLINALAEDELIRLFQSLGEVRNPHRVVRAIVNDRREKLFSTTRELAGLIERVDGWRKKGQHPATQYFLALRMQVNQELESTEAALVPLIHGLKTKGRLAVLTFHSLEDRIVKNVFKTQEALGFPVNKKVIVAQWDEAKKNPRARSAKLRVFERAENRAEEQATDRGSSLEESLEVHLQNRDRDRW